MKDCTTVHLREGGKVVIISSIFSTKTVVKKMIGDRNLSP